MNPADEWTRRTFLRSVSAAPTLTLISAAAAQNTGSQAGAKFTPWDLEPHFNATRADLSVPDWVGREIVRETGGVAPAPTQIETPSGTQTLRGIPFRLGPPGSRDKAWLVVGTGRKAAGRTEIPLGRAASHLCLAHFCDWDENEVRPQSIDAIDRVGQRLADATLVYEDGSTHVAPIRRRLEIN